MMQILMKWFSAMNSPAHNLKKSLIFQSQSSNYPVSMINLNAQHVKSPPFKTRENINDFSHQSKNITINRHQSSKQVQNHMTSSVSSHGGRWHHDSAPIYDSKENSLQKRVGEMQTKLNQIVFQIERIQQKQKSVPTTPMVKNLILEELNKKQKQAQCQESSKKAEIQNMKNQIRGLISRKEMDKTIGQMQVNIKGAIHNIKNNLCQELLEAQERQGKLRKKEIDDLEKKVQISKMELGNSLKKINEKFIIFCENNINSSTKMFKGKTLSIKILTNFIMKLEAGKKKDSMEQVEYRVDNEGYLLDSDNHYLINENGQQIRLSEEDLRVLEQKGFLKKN